MYNEEKIIYGLRFKAHRLMDKVFGKNNKQAYLWRSRRFGNIHFADMNKSQLLNVIKDLYQIIKVK